MSDSSKFQRVIESFLTFQDRPAEDAFLAYVLEQATFQRQQMGFCNDRNYQPSSTLAMWQTYQEQFEQDFSRRALDPTDIFCESNLSLNLPLTQISQHYDRISQDLLDSPTFFGPISDGREDENPAIDIMKRWLHYRAKKIQLHKTCKDGVLGAFIRGQEVTRVAFNPGVYRVPTKVTPLLIDGKPLRDSQGQEVTMADKWITDTLRPGVLVLERDQMVTVPEDATMSSGKTRIEMVSRYVDPGADIRIVYYGDFVITANAESIDAAPFKGHYYRMNPGIMLMQWPEDTRAEGYGDYALKVKNNTLTASPWDDYNVQKVQPRRRDGEDMAGPGANQMGDRHGYQDRTYLECWLKYDVNADGVPEDVYCMVDLAQKLLIHYEYAAIALPWSNDMRAPHPYRNQRIRNKPGRWTGRGQYELLQTPSLIGDRMVNRIEIDSSTSGNVAFENPNATLEGMDGTGIQFRTRQAYTLRGNFTKEEAFGVVTVAPANLEIFKLLMEKMEERADLTGGNTSPQAASVRNVPGKDTLGAAQILENTATAASRSLESDIVVGLTSIMEAFVDVEVWAILNQPQTQEALVEQVGPENAALLMEWLKANPGKWRTMFEVSLTKAHSSQILEITDAKIRAVQQFDALPPAYKPVRAPLYVDILRGLGDSNPEQTLNVDAVLAADQATAEAQAAAAAPEEVQQEAA